MSKLKQLKEKICVICNKNFPIAYPVTYAKYCSPDCRRKANNQRCREKYHNNIEKERKRSIKYYNRNKHNPDFIRKRKERIERWREENKAHLKLYDHNKYLENKEAKAEYNKSYNMNTRRKYYLSGKRLKYPKRDFQGECELCNKEFKRMRYHHWDDSKPHLGIWCCQGDQLFMHKVEDGLVGKYLRLRGQIIESDISEKDIPK